jgi:membrane protease YdiL (CAAX protease family)
MEIAEKKSISINSWVALFAVASLLPLLLKTVAGLAGLAPGSRSFAAYSGTVLLMLGGTLALLRRSVVGLGTSLRCYAENIGRDFVLGALLAGGLMLLGVAMDHLGLKGDIGVGPGDMIRQLPVFASGYAGMAAVYLLMALMVPLYEELFFRRLLYVSLRKRYPVGRAVFVAGLLFGLLHLHALVYASLVGMSLCLAYEKTGRLDVVIFAHIINNFCSTSFKIFGS